ncbi:WD40 repeat-like protein [Myriangium duriaei CBS 260.36]|uniref:WD40 repeat-like protein n=1 Tax=Myriangium duriaei CBS 260.36 TaxID=1168546 RepID=A0A9P4IUH9_9PEZI|nr:WD40 repeat-like protein [Myriangium duriaei CBS 260.36]
MAATSTKGRVPTGFADEIIISDTSFRSAHRAIESNQEPASKKRKREGKGDSSVVYGAGAYKGPWAKFEQEMPDDSSGEEEEIEVEYEEDEIAPQPSAPAKAGMAYEETGDGKETSEFHGSQLHDYQGRTYMHVPQDLDIDLRGDISELKNYVPKRAIHTFKSHTKAITQMRFFPSSGHLLLSASADSKIKIWDVYHQRELLRTYSGHTKSVSDISYNYNGTHFLSASYDRSIKLWDTETGACVSRFSTGATPHVVRFNPSASNATEFLAGMSDKKIVQFDTRIPQPGDKDAERDPAKPVQEYDHHLGPINTLVWYDDNRRFLSTSDDRSLRAWEYNIPVPIKLVADPSMFAMVRAAPHPSGKYVAYQSADNQIVVYSVGEKVRLNRKKGFRGHNTAGYAVDLDFSPDGSLLVSGDSSGSAVFWDWKSGKQVQKLKAASGAVVSCAWHPRETSKVATAGLDGAITYWD